jgi:predicted DNA-binding ribbon-helix-helix protein
VSGAGVVKRSVAIAGHATSVSLEGPFWDALRAIAAAEGVSVQALIGRIDAERGGQNLSSAIRVHVLRAVQRQAETGAGREPVPDASSGPPAAEGSITDA